MSIYKTIQVIFYRTKPQEAGSNLNQLQVR